MITKEDAETLGILIAIVASAALREWRTLQAKRDTQVLRAIATNSAEKVDEVHSVVTGAPTDPIPSPQPKSVEGINPT